MVDEYKSDIQNVSDKQNKSDNQIHTEPDDYSKDKSD